MEDWLIYLLRNELIAFICFEVAAFRDATKEMDKKFRGDDTYGSYFRHKENWHLETTGIWVRLLMVFAIVLGDWKILLNALRMLNLDLKYYIYKWFINPAKTFLPENLNWFISDWNSKFNPFRLFGKDFDRKEFILTVLITNIITIILILIFYFME
jgi:hypothetical protein